MKKTLFDTKKEEIEQSKQFYKTRRKVIKTQIKEIDSNNNLLYITSGISLIGTLTSIDILYLTKEPLVLTMTLVTTICALLSIIEAKKSYTKEELETLKNLKINLQEINKLIKQQKISKEEKKELKKIKVSHI